MSFSVHTIKKYIHRMIAYIISFILRPGAIYDNGNFKIWERRGYHITPLHFYYPIPDTRELEKEYPKKYTSPGIDYQPGVQLQLLKEFARFSDEYNSFVIDQSSPDRFYLRNDAFSGIDPHIYYCMIRHFMPQRVIEIGSGFSTLIGRQACTYSIKTHYTCIDPWPRDFIRKNIPEGDIVFQKVEDIPISYFEAIQSNDILFIDSSHVIRNAGDICFLVLEVLPRLKKGVIIHFHDIYLPDDYPKDLLVKDHMFWDEQYLLQAYISDNPSVEVLFGSGFMNKEHESALKEIFPNALWWGGGSFWIRKR